MKPLIKPRKVIFIELIEKEIIEMLIHRLDLNVPFGVGMEFLVRVEKASISYNFSVLLLKLVFKNLS